MKAILIDAGHGGFQAGHSSPSGLLEKNLALALAEELQESIGDTFQTYMVRASDNDVSHRTRARMAATVDLTISLHWHSCPNPHVKRVLAGGRVREAEEIGRLLLDRLGKATGDRSEYRQTLARICNKTPKPVVFVMAGYISNPETERDIVDGGRIERVAAAITAGLKQHYSVA